VSLRSLFGPDDLLALEGLYERAANIIPMQDVYAEADYSNDIAVRHDCDNVILPAVAMSSWEAARGYLSTYYILHTSPYWREKPLLRESLDWIASNGHEIGIHNDALTVALETGRDPAAVLHEAIAELRSYGHDIRSTVAHGNQLCHVVGYVNDEMFQGCSRPSYGDAERTQAGAPLRVRVGLRRELVAARRLPERFRWGVVAAVR
jgi:hypothetical protein